jgi:hypothetical protein
MSDIIVVVETDINIATVEQQPDTVTVVEPNTDVVEVSAGVKGDPGQDATVLYGTGLPPDPAGLQDGALYIRYTE